ncbi:MAG: thioredoxin [Holosporales bacterium]|jgi:thioredoxin 1|nr:thioredoxin [Holosporales bacterium]
MLIDLIDIDSLNETLYNTNLVLLDFWAQWCGPCRMLSSILDEVQTELKDGVTIVKINVDESKEIAAEYGIQSLPTLILFKNREKLGAKNGFMSKSSIIQWIDESLEGKIDA